MFAELLIFCPMKDMIKLLFDDGIKKQVEVTRKVCDVATIAKDIMVMGAVQVGLQRADTFVNAV